MSNEFAVRIRGEYMEMPGLCLTVPQAARLWQRSREECEQVLARLVREGFLVRTRNGAFVKVPSSRPRPAKASLTARSAEAAGGRLKRPQPPSVLLLDPFADEGEMYATYLGACGFGAVAVCEAEQGIELAMRTAPDVVIARFRQSGRITGLDVVRRLKAHPATRHTPVMIITTSINSGDRQAALSIGCDRYLLLPLVPDVLVQEIRKLLAAASEPAAAG